MSRLSYAYRLCLAKGCAPCVQSKCGMLGELGKGVIERSECCSSACPALL
jgi:hypothetical protein